MTKNHISNGSLLLSQTTTITLLLASAVLYGFGIGATMPALQTWIINIVPANRRSIASATFYNFMDIGVGGGSIILGLFAGKTGYASIYLYSAAIMVIFLISYGYYNLRHKSSVNNLSTLKINSNDNDA